MDYKEINFCVSHASQREKKLNVKTIVKNTIRTYNIVSIIIIGTFVRSPVNNLIYVVVENSIV